MSKRTLRALALLLAALLTVGSQCLAEENTLCGLSFPADATEATLSDVRLPSAGELAKELEAFPALKRLSLNRCGLTLKALKQIKDALPGVEVRADFECFGQTLSTETVSVILDDRQPERRRDLLDFLSVTPKLKTLDMYGYDISVKDMQEIMDQYPSVRFGWKVKIKKSRSLPSNATAYSTKHSHEIENDMRNRSEDFGVLPAYCPDLLALDLGHNAIDDLSFLTAYPKLKVLILADNKIDDISLLSHLTQVEYLELFMNRITDLTPLQSMTGLRDLNLCYNKITDITPLLSLKNLERCWISHNQISDEDKALLVQSMPNTHFEFETRLSTQAGWRVHSHYDTIFSMFKGFTYVPFTE